jgi:flagellar hook protein FlgE
VRDSYVSLNQFGQLIVRVGDSQWLLEPSIHIPLSEPFSVQSDGKVLLRTMTASNGEPVWPTVGQLSLAVFDRPDKLRKVRPGVYEPTEESGSPTMTTPGENNAGFVRHSF